MKNVNLNFHSMHKQSVRIQHRPLFLLTVWLLAYLTTIPTFASEQVTVAALSEDDFLADIPVVLTATRLAQPITEAPAAITIIDQEMIRASGAREIADLFRMVPGFVVSHDSGHQPIVSYHGLTDEYAVRLQVLVDGRSVYSPVFGGVDWSNLPLAMDDIERIEIIRGPNAASYGSNSFLSIINIITKHASETTGTFARGTRGSNGAKDVYARYGNTTGDFDYRITAGVNNDNGFKDRADDRRIKIARFRGDYQVNAKDNLMFQTGHTDGILEIDSKKLQAVTNRDVNITFEQTRWQRQISNQESLSLQFFHTLENVSQIFDVDLTLPPAIHVVVNSSTRSERYDFELQHTKQLLANTRLVWGLGLREDSAKGPDIFGTDPALGYTGTREYFYNTVSRLFTNVEWRARNNVTVNLGAMLEKSDLADLEFSPRLGVNYSITPQHSIRFIASRATRTPSLNETYSNFSFPVETLSTPPVDFTSTAWKGNNNINPERITSYEIAYHANIVKQKVSLDIKRYREIFRDLITLDGNTITNSGDPFLGGYEIYDNVTDATIDGIETNLEFFPLQNTRLILSHSYTHIDSHNPNVTWTQLRDSAPKHVTSILAINRFPGEVTGSVLYYRVSESNGLGSGNPLPGYKHVNLRLALPIKWLGATGEIAFVVQNATGGYTDWRTENTAETQKYISISAQWD